MNVPRESWTGAAEAAVITRRGQAHYEATFGPIGPDELVLDLGSGGSNYALSNLVKLDILYGEYGFIPGNCVAGIFQELPFRDETFNRTIASFSLFHVTKGLVESLSEAARVTKVGGTVEVLPVLGSRVKAKITDLKAEGIDTDIRIVQRNRDKLLAASALGGMIVAVLSSPSVRSGLLAGLSFGSGLIYLHEGRVLVYSRTEADSSEEERLRRAQLVSEKVKLVSHHNPQRFLKKRKLSREKQS